MSCKPTQNHYRHPSMRMEQVVSYFLPLKRRRGVVCLFINIAAFTFQSQGPSYHGGISRLAEQCLLHLSRDEQYHQSKLGLPRHLDHAYYQKHTLLPSVEDAKAAIRTRYPCTVEGGLGSNIRGVPQKNLLGEIPRKAYATTPWCRSRRLGLDLEFMDTCQGP